MANLKGETLLGRYQVLESVGRGGMADVYRALDQKRNQEVALKVLREDLAADENVRQRFVREANVLEKLTHKSIVRVYEFEEEGELAFLVMDFVAGTTLNKYLKAHRLTLGQALHVLEQVCPALNYAHEEGYVHRDIKPSNIMIRFEDARVLLSDFGIARAIEESATESTEAIGTPGYMSPEQFLGRSLDQTTDIYSLGVVAYEMVIGRNPFTSDIEKSTGSTREEVRRRHIYEDPPHPSMFNPNLPKALGEIIMQALRKRPSERPQSAMEFLGEFKAGCLSQGITSEKLEMAPGPLSPPSRLPPPPIDRPEQNRRGRESEGTPHAGDNWQKPTGSDRERVRVHAPGGRRRTPVLAIVGIVVFLLLALVVGMGRIVNGGDPQSLTTPLLIPATQIVYIPSRPADGSGTPVAALTATRAIDATPTTDVQALVARGIMASRTAEATATSAWQTAIAQAMTASAPTPSSTATATLRPSATPTPLPTATATPKPPRQFSAIALRSPQPGEWFKEESYAPLLEWRPLPEGPLDDDQWYRIQVYRGNEMGCNLYTKETMFGLPPARTPPCNPEIWKFNTGDWNWRVSAVKKTDDDFHHDVEIVNSEGRLFKWFKP